MAHIRLDANHITVWIRSAPSQQSRDPRPMVALSGRLPVCLFPRSVKRETQSASADEPRRPYLGPIGQR